MGLNICDMDCVYSNISISWSLSAIMVSYCCISFKLSHKLSFTLAICVCVFFSVYTRYNHQTSTSCRLNTSIDRFLKKKKTGKQNK